MAPSILWARPLASLAPPIVGIPPHWLLPSFGPAHSCRWLRPLLGCPPHRLGPPTFLIGSSHRLGPPTPLAGSALYLDPSHWLLSYFGPAHFPYWLLLLVGSHPMPPPLTGVPPLGSSHRVGPPTRLAGSAHCLDPPLIGSCHHLGPPSHLAGSAHDLDPSHWLLSSFTPAHFPRRLLLLVGSHPMAPPMTGVPPLGSSHPVGPPTFPTGSSHWLGATGRFRDRMRMRGGKGGDDGSLCGRHGGG